MNLFTSLQHNSLRADCNHKLNGPYKFSKNRLRSRPGWGLINRKPSCTFVAIHPCRLNRRKANIHTNCKYSVGSTDCQYNFFKISYSTGLYALFTACLYFNRDASCDAYAGDETLSPDALYP